MISPSPMKSPDRDAADELIAAIILDICELPDRSRPMTRPEDVTLSVTELRGILERHLPSELATLRRRVAEMEGVLKEFFTVVRRKCPGIINDPLYDKIEAAIAPLAANAPINCPKCARADDPRDIDWQLCEKHREPPPEPPKSPLAEAIEKARGGPAPVQKRGYA